LELARQKAAALDPDKPAYDVLLDEFEPGASADAVAALFRDLRRPLVELVAAIAGSKRRPNDAVVARTYPVDRQKIFGEMAAGEIGFDFRRGRLDATTHPFCATLGPHDCRITTRYNPRYFNEAFFGILHEAGHGLYEQGLDAAHFGEPMGEAASLGLHESQSRLWENAVGRSLPFWRLYFPRARAVFHEALADASLDEFHFAVNKVAPSLIRVEADEVTYNLHVLIRFELEQALVHKDLAPQELPAAWNEKYRDYLGVAPPDDATGCLQDVHWSHGLIGYFPTYTLGNVYAAQLWDKAEAELGGLDEILERGEFRVLLGWLRERVHRHGKRFLPERLMREATGSPPNAVALVRSLRRKFEPLYEL
jgi:carboxypeptidase Taq